MRAGLHWWKCAFGLVLLATSLATSGQSPPSAPPETTHTEQSLAEAPAAERQTLQRLLEDDSWPRRAIAAIRLERYRCEASLSSLTTLLNDKNWQVRAFATRSLARRRVPQRSEWFQSEDEPRVIRTAMRYRYTIEPQRISRAVRILAKSNDLEERFLAVELGAASDDPELKEIAAETAKQVILRMSRSQAGVLSPRLAAVTGERHARRAFEWQRWLMKNGRKFQIQPAYRLDPEAPTVSLSAIAQLDAEEFAGLEDYISKLGKRELDLAILLDCTASMSGEIAAAQGGIDDMMLFVGDMVSSLRVGLVAYRDRRDEFETKAWDFTDAISTARQQLWQLAAEGGGDTPEAVYPALKVALTKLSWRPESTKVLVIVGDAPPHIGYGLHCVEMVQKSRAQSQLTTHVIQASAKEIKHFPEIAKAGGGRCVSLEDDDTLMAEITGLTLGDRYQEEFREFFHTYLELCR
jgi:Mg-chelatase subunit ChlD